MHYAIHFTCGYVIVDTNRISLLREVVPSKRIHWECITIPTDIFAYIYYMMHMGAIHPSLKWNDVTLYMVVEGKRSRTHIIHCSNDFSLIISIAQLRRSITNIGNPERIGELVHKKHTFIKRLCSHTLNETRSQWNCRTPSIIYAIRVGVPTNEGNELLVGHDIIKRRFPSELWFYWWEKTNSLDRLCYIHPMLSNYLSIGWISN